MKKSKIVIVVQCRYRSTRLPGKALLPFVDNMSILEFLLRRLLLVKKIDDIILTTGKHKSNKPIIEISNKLNIKVIEGNEKNVLKRFCDAARLSNADIIVRVCADNPLTDPFLISELINFFVSKKDIDHLSTFKKPSLPFGSGCAIFSRKALFLTSLKSKNDLFSKEHVEPFMLKSALIKTHYYKKKGFLHFPDLRLSIDYLKDYEFLKPIVSYLYNKKKFNFKTQDVISLIKKPKVALFANGEFGLMVTKFLKSNNIDIVCVITHPDINATKKKEIIDASKLDKKKIIDYKQLKKNQRWINKFEPSIALSCWSSYIFNDEMINKFPLGAYNFHNSLLPTLGGSGANIWAIIDKKNTGATMHRISTKIDAGPIIDQRQIQYTFSDTGYSLLRKQHKKMLMLLKNNWQKILVNKHIYLNSNHTRSFIKKKKRDKFKQINLNKKYKAIDFINILRAYQFSNKDSCFFLDKKKLWNLQIKITKRKI